mmetsp:Transcript_67948/g.162193  ORF Transcript_67948/g.162193 Transcript_67948/m.162193 type:complete len:214 (-) Transcript_67948:710-1351(-)
MLLQKPLQGLLVAELLSTNAPGPRRARQSGDGIGVKASHVGQANGPQLWSIWIRDMDVHLVRDVHGVDTRKKHGLYPLHLVVDIVLLVKQFLADLRRQAQAVLEEGIHCRLPTSALFNEGRWLLISPDKSAVLENFAVQAQLHLMAFRTHDGETDVHQLHVSLQGVILADEVGLLLHRHIPVEFVQSLCLALAKFRNINSMVQQHLPKLCSAA